MSNNDGGMAFPFFDEKVMNSPEWGMSLHDYFAAKAMQPVIAHLISQGGATDPEDAAAIAQVAYFMADAMLAERAK